MAAIQASDFVARFDKLQADALREELAAQREELAALRTIAENLRERYYDGAKPGWAELKQYLDETAEPSSIQHGHL